MNDQKSSNNFTGFSRYLLPKAQKLRASMTKQEKHLWYDYLRSCPAKFYRQRPLGIYIADFYCSSAKLIIELDGSQHYSDEGKAYDKARTEIINRYGIAVVRYSNYDVDHNFYGVCADIDRIVTERRTSRQISNYTPELS